MNRTNNAALKLLFAVWIFLTLLFYIKLYVLPKITVAFTK